MEVITHHKHAYRILDILLALYRAKKFPYNLSEARVPHVPENLPPNGFRSDADKAHWFFLLCLFMRGKIRSFTAARNLSRVYSNWPEMFVPETAVVLLPEVVRERIVGCGLGFNQVGNARSWIENMIRVREHYNSDIRHVFSGVSTYTELCGRVCNSRSRRKKNAKSFGPGFIGFQEKMVSMLAYYLVDSGLVPRFEFPMPVDFQVSRMSLAHQFVTVKGVIGDMFKPELQEALRNLSLRYGRLRGVTPEEMSELLWCFSSSMCKGHPGNVSTWVGPNRKRGALIVPREITWSDAQRQSYNRTCGQCPVEVTCKYCVAAAPHYNNGTLDIRGPRQKPPQQRLFPPICVVTRESREWRGDTMSRERSGSEQQLRLFEENE